AGTAAGAIVGRVLGGSTKGAIIGGVIGGAVGAQRAVETKDRDVVVPQGASVTLTLDEKLMAGS
ncbi:MAG TPA: glycine zipper domain-containing protein, partial [Gemmatimonadales bacterium]|nr:glycine zipper domain-containing protein [Gemmatimonadales bacterium]